MPWLSLYTALVGISLLASLGFDAPETSVVEARQVAQSPPSHADDDVCTYEMYNWSTTRSRAVNRHQVTTTFGELPEDGRDPEDARCSLCSENQERIALADFGLDMEDIYVCDVYADAVRAAIQTIVDSGEFELVELKGYRPGRTRGHVSDGLRTELSNHSYGTAIDINAHQNGLYRSCNVDEVTPETIAGCRLGIGGEWDPLGDPRHTVVQGGVVYRAFTQGVGWRWGGEIEGRTRDLMHFSQTGY